MATLQPKAIPWVIFGLTSIFTSALIFYSLSDFYEEYRIDTEAMQNIVIPRRKQAFIEFDFGGGGKRIFAGNIKKEVYPLEFALRSVSLRSNLNIEIRAQGGTKQLVKIDDVDGSWTVYRNGVVTQIPIDQLTIASGERYMFKLVK